MMKAKWYRNPPEKDQDKPQGTGEIIHFGLLERTGEGIVVLVDDEGNLVEKPFSLVRIVVNPELQRLQRKQQEEVDQEYINHYSNTPAEPDHKAHSDKPEPGHKAHSDKPEPKAFVAKATAPTNKTPHTKAKVI